MVWPFKNKHEQAPAMDPAAAGQMQNPDTSGYPAGALSTSTGEADPNLAYTANAQGAESPQTVNVMGDLPTRTSTGMEQSPMGPDAAVNTAPATVNFEPAKPAATLGGNAINNSNTIDQPLPVKVPIEVKDGTEEAVAPVPAATEATSGLPAVEPAAASPEPETAPAPPMPVAEPAPASPPISFEAPLEQKPVYQPETANPNPMAPPTPGDSITPQASVEHSASGNENRQPPASPPEAPPAPPETTQQY